MLAEYIGKTIRNRRKELRITQPHLAELAKVSTNTLYKLERGQGNPSLDVLTKITDARKEYVDKARKVLTPQQLAKAIVFQKNLRKLMQKE